MRTPPNSKQLFLVEYDVWVDGEHYEEINMDNLERLYALGDIIDEQVQENFGVCHNTMDFNTLMNERYNLEYIVRKESPEKYKEYVERYY